MLRGLSNFSKALSAMSKIWRDRPLKVTAPTMVEMVVSRRAAFGMSPPTLIIALNRTLDTATRVTATRSNQ